MAKVKFEKTLTLDVLGKWQQPILDIIKEKLPGSRPAYAPLPMGRAGLVVEWDGFYGRDPTDRQDIVRFAIANLGPDPSKLISMIVTLTQEEAAGAKDS